MSAIPPVLSGRLSKAPLDGIADALGCDDSTACRVRTGEYRATIQQFCALLDHLNLKPVDKAAVCVSRAKFDAMATLLSAAMADEGTARKLIFEEPE